MNKSFIIDGTTYDVPIIELQRKGDILDLTARRRDDGVLERDVIGTYYNFSVKVGFIRDNQVRKDLWDKLTEPVASHEISIPGQDESFEGYFGSVKDDVIIITDEGVLTHGLSFNVVCTNPSIVAS